MGTRTLRGKECFSLLLISTGSKFPEIENEKTRMNEMKGAFYPNKTFGLNFRQLLVANGTVSSKISKKDGQSREIYPNFRKFFPEVFFPFNFALGISRIIG